MNFTTSPRGTGRITIPGIVCLLMLSACGNSAGDNVAGKAAEANAPAASESQSIAAGSARPATSPATPASNASQVNETQKRETRNTNDARVSTAPKPEIGTGGNDFFQFTQARAALGADAELKTANILVEVKAGVLTLTGTVANAAQKSKAEELVRTVGGVKDVRNQLRISG